MASFKCTACGQVYLATDARSAYNQHTTWLAVDPAETNGGPHLTAEGRWKNFSFVPVTVGNTAGGDIVDGPNTAAPVQSVDNPAGGGALDGPDTSARVVAGGGKGAGGEMGAGGGVPATPQSVSATPQVSRAEMESHFYSTLTNAIDQAKAGNPTLLQNFDRFFGINRNPAEYTAGYYLTQDQNANRWVNNNFSIFDKDASGTLDEAESGAASWAQYDDAQKADGVLTKEEVLAMFNRRMDAGITDFNASGDPQLTNLWNAIDGMVKANDVNSDHKLTREELGEQVWLQYSEKARADGYISETEAGELVKNRVDMGFTQSTSDFSKGSVGVAIDKLMGTDGINRLFSVADVEQKLGGVKLPDWMVNDGQISDTELATFINNEVSGGNLAFDDTKGVVLTPNSELTPVVVATEPPVPPVSDATTVTPQTNESGDTLGSGGLASREPKITTIPIESKQVPPEKLEDGATSSSSGSDIATPSSVGTSNNNTSSSSGSSANSGSSVDYSRDTKDSGFAYPWSAAKSVGASDVPATIEKALNFMNAVEGRSYQYDKVKGTITTQEGSFISRDDVQALNNIITRYHDSDFAIPETVASTQSMSSNAVGSAPQPNRPLFNDITGGAVKIDAQSSNGLNTIGGGSGIAGAAVKPSDAGFKL